ncbi:hypothetical protein AX15_002901 [Amanita polypyramis BW_CC]|nr:hypothetical protein AX15_002901 [Amanita polypyramis BW_CC]
MLPLIASEIDVGQKTKKQDVAELEHFKPSLMDLPNEILSYIFILRSCYYFVQLPYRRSSLPYQLIISHVCSRWRQLALNTGELWSKVEISWYCPRLPRNVFIYNTWVSRAGGHALNIVFNSVLTSTCGTCKNMVMPYRVKKLNIALSYEQLSALSVLDLDIEELAIGLTGFVGDGDFLLADVPPFISRTRSVTFWNFHDMSPGEFDGLSKALCLPWQNLRILEGYSPPLPLSAWLDVLHQTPLLEECHLNICGVKGDHIKEVTMPNVRRFTIGLQQVHPDAVIPLITVPKLTSLGICSPDAWSADTYNIIKKQHKLDQLEQLQLQSQYPLSVTNVLKDVPMVHNLHLRGNPILDDEAREKIVNGQLGRFLTQLCLGGCGDNAKEWLDMVETRQKNVRAMLQNVTNWRDAFTGLKRVEFWNVKNKGAYEGRLAPLKLLGVDVELF